MVAACLHALVYRAGLLCLHIRGSVQDCDTTQLILWGCAWHTALLCSLALAFSVKADAVA